jgi:hypothetical protein
MTEDSQYRKRDHRDERDDECVLDESLSSIVLKTCPSVTQIHIISFGSHAEKFITEHCLSNYSRAFFG